MSEEKVITRFAPSPTGFMHVGNIRSALFAWLWTRKNNGTFILRIEDTDKEREVSGSISHIIESLKWLGITWDEGPETGGPHASYLQSERLSLYRQYAEKLIANGLAYPDPYTEAEVESFRQKAEIEKKPFLFREHRPENFDVWDGTRPLRFKVPEIKSYAWHDIVFGDLSAGPEALDDFIMIKSDGYPTYNFAHIVDDIEMGITLVMRGQEYISSTPKFLSMYEALGITPPLYACLPHIMASDGKKKLGKRDGAKDILDYREEGYLPDAMINFLAFLGWNPGDEREIFTREELIQAFDVTKIQKSGAKVNQEKLDWINREHILKLNDEEFTTHAKKYLPDSISKLATFSEGIFSRMIPILRERINKFSDIKEMSDRGELTYFFNKPDINTLGLTYKDTPSEVTKGNLENVFSILSNLTEGEFTKEIIKDSIMQALDPKDRGSTLHPMRFALSGLDKSPDPFILADILGKSETLERLSIAITMLAT